MQAQGESMALAPLRRSALAGSGRRERRRRRTRPERHRRDLRQQTLRQKMRMAMLRRRELAFPADICMSWSPHRTKGPGFLSKKAQQPNRRTAQ